MAEAGKELPLNRFLHALYAVFNSLGVLDGNRMIRGKLFDRHKNVLQILWIELKVLAHLIPQISVEPTMLKAT